MYISLIFFHFTFPLFIMKRHQIQSLHASVITTLIQGVIHHGALWRFRLRAYNLGTVPLTNTRMNTPILLPVTGHCTCQSGAAEATTPGSHFQVGFVWLTGHYLSYVLQKRHRRCTHSQLQVFVISSSSHEKKLINWCLIFSFVQNILSREDTSSTLLVHAILNIKI